MAWYAAAGEGVPVECHAREGGELLSEDTVKRCRCRKYAGLQRGGESEGEGECWREEEKKRKKERRRRRSDCLALAGASRAGVTIAGRVFLADAT